MAPYGVDEPQPKSSARMTTMLGFALCAAGAVENAVRRTVIQTERDLRFIRISGETYFLRSGLVYAVQIDWARKRMVAPQRRRNTTQRKGSKSDAAMWVERM